MNEQVRLEHAHADLEWLLNGDKITLALKRSQEWVKVGLPGTSGDSHRGGSSSPTETEERLADRLTARRAETVLLDFRELAPRIAADLARLAAHVRWATEPIKPDLIPQDVPCSNPGCEHRQDGRQVSEPGRKLCAACHKWQTRHGVPFPKRRGDIRTEVA